MHCHKYKPKLSTNETFVIEIEIYVIDFSSPYLESEAMAIVIDNSWCIIFWVEVNTILAFLTINTENGFTSTMKWCVKKMYGWNVPPVVKLERQFALLVKEPISVYCWRLNKNFENEIKMFGCSLVTVSFTIISIIFISQWLHFIAFNKITIYRLVGLLCKWGQLPHWKNLKVSSNQS